MVLTHEMVESFIEEFVKELKVRLADVTRHLDADRKREAKLKGQLKHFYAVLGEHGNFEMLKDEIAERESELKVIRERLLGTGRDSVEINSADIRAYVTKRLMDLKGLLNQDVAVAKGWLREHFGPITMSPAGEGKNRYYVASGNCDLLGDGKECEIPVLAGGGFEPPTFGL
jgi:hypothetical protein